MSRIINVREITVNGKPRSVDVDDDTPLLWVLRDVLRLNGTKFGCGLGLCGACTVHIDGVATRSCTAPVGSLGKRPVTTIEHLSASKVGTALQRAWLDQEVVQCGYCQSGQLMAAADLLARNATPTDAEIDTAMAGNLCRCGTYLRVRRGIKAAHSLTQPAKKASS